MLKLRRRRFGNDGVSAITGVVLMVALVVVLTAGVFVWIASGFSVGGNTTKFPQLIAKDAPDACTAGAGDDLFTVEHVAGDSITWDHFTLELFDGATNLKGVVDWGGSGTGVLPVGLSVSQTLTAAETTDICTAGASEQWTLRIINTKNENEIVYEFKELIVK